MSHIIFGLYAHKGTHEKLVSEINNWRYEHVGEQRVGYSAPLISELKLYDVRLPEKLVPLFMRDLQMQGAPMVGGGSSKHKFTWLLMKALQIGRRLLGFERVVVAEGEQQYKLKTSWHHAFLVGVMKDDVQKDELTGKSKEVL